MKRTAPFSKAAIRNACIAGAFALLPIGVIGFGAIADAANKQNVASCNGGTLSACYDVPSYLEDQITNKGFLATRKAAAEATAKADAETLRLAAEKKAADMKAAKEAADRKAAAEAKFKAEGWFQLQPGIYGRWCTKTCSRAEVIGDAAYWLMEVWAKDAPAGDIYAQVNVLQNGVVVGWTNDTAYLSKGQRGVLTFSKYLPGYGSQYTAQLTKFNARG